MARAAILGTGLIGASLGMALRQVGWSVAGWDPNVDALAVAAQRQAVDDSYDTIDDTTRGADLIVLAGPLNATIATLGLLKTGALVTDVAGVKVPIIQAAPAGMRLVAGHPMAGRERGGPGAATPALFKGAAWILCPDEAAPHDVDTVANIVESLGALPVRMSAAEHDRVVATISHLPQIIAASLVNQVADDPRALGLVSGSFRDLTRVAASEPGWWPEILAANVANVSDAIDDLVARLAAIRREMSGDSDALMARLASARTTRREMAPPVVRVGVVLQDKPGEIAAVGRALAESSVDVRDLQLRHALHGGGGVLTLSVRPGEAEALRAALIAEEFDLE